MASKFPTSYRLLSTTQSSDQAQAGPYFHTTERKALSGSWNKEVVYFNGGDQAPQLLMAHGVAVLPGLSRESRLPIARFCWAYITRETDLSIFALDLNLGTTSTLRSCSEKCPPPGHPSGSRYC